MAGSKCRLLTDPLSEESKQLAAKELRETPEIKEAALTELRGLLRDATDLYYHDDEATLLVFLRPTHFYPESALNLVSEICIYNFKTTYYISKNTLELNTEI